MTYPHDATGHDGGRDAGQTIRWDGGDRAAGAAELPPVTGDPVVDEAVGQLQYVTEVPVDEQPGIYDAVHRTLQDRLADVEG